MSNARRENDSGSVEAAPTRRTLVFPSVAVARASERPTLKTLPPVDPPSSGQGNTEVIELSASALDSDVSMVDLAGERESEPGSGGVAAAAARPTGRRRVVLAAAVVALLVGASPTVVSRLGERTSGVSAELRRAPREPREAASQHTPLGERVAARAPSAPPGGCAALGAPRVLSARAHLPPGLDVSVLDGGFGVGFASSSDEALGLRLRLPLDGLPLRIAERVRVRGHGGPRMRHVAVEAPRVEGAGGGGEGREGRDDEELDVRVDADESRSVVPEGAGAGAPLRMSVNGGWVRVSVRGKGAARTLWPVPGVAVKVNGAAAAAVATGELRVASRGDGGAIVVLRRPSALWLGLVNAELSAEGPLVPLTRAGAVLGTPSVAPLSGGGAVAWAEKPAGEQAWRVMVARFADRERPGFMIRPIAAGMSPSIAALPGGDLLLAYAVGAPGAHQVMVRRLGHDLEATGEAVVVSPDAVNAGQPATAVAADGRALVAFFGAERGRPSSVLATPLTCSLGL